MTGLAGSASDREHRTFLVEHYQPGLDEVGGRRWLDRAAAATGAHGAEGVVLLAGTVVPRDECLLCEFSAPSTAVLLAVLARAGLSFDRVSEAIHHAGVAGTTEPGSADGPITEGNQE